MVLTLMLFPSLFLTALMERSGVSIDLSVHSFNILFEFPVGVSDVVEVFSHFSQRVNIVEFFNLTTQVLLGLLGYFYLLVWGVLVIGNSTSVLKGIMHSKFLFEISNFLFVSLDQKLGVHLDIYDGFIADSHHPCGKLKSRNSFFNVRRLGPDISYHQSFAVTTQ